MPPSSVVFWGQSTGNRGGCAHPQSCWQHPESLFHLCHWFPSQWKVYFGDYCDACNREEHPAQMKLTDQRRGAVTRGSTLCSTVDGFVASNLWKSNARFLPFAVCQTPSPLRLYQKPSLWFPSCNSVLALSIISCSQQTLVLIKDVNL